MYELGYCLLLLLLCERKLTTFPKGNIRYKFVFKEPPYRINFRLGEIQYFIFNQKTEKPDEGLREFETVIQTREVVEDLCNFREFSQLLECLHEVL